MAVTRRTRAAAAEAPPEDERARRAAYFRAYYAAHREEILAKNRRWAREHRARIAERRRAKAGLRSPGPPRACPECGAPIGPRALRCRRCYVRVHYANDPQTRARRAALNRRARDRRK